MLTGARFVVDTNVLIDYLVERKPFNAKAEILMALGYINEFELWIGTSQVSDIVYVITEGGKPSLSEYAQDTMTALKKMLHIYTTDAEDYDNVARCSFDDLEDAFVFQAALKVKADAIITRDKAGFAHSSVKVFDCDELFDRLAKEKGIEYEKISGAFDICPE